MLLPHTSTFPFPFPLFNSLSHFYSKRKRFSLSWLFLYLTSSSTSLSLSPLVLFDLFISSINYLTFSSTYLSLSPLELPDLFISLINCIPNFLFKSYVGIFFSLPVVPMVLSLFESQRSVLSPLVSLFIFCCYIHLGALSCMSL